MSTADFSRFIAPDKVPRIPPEGRRMDFEHYPPFLERLLGVWGPLSRQPFRGISSDGVIQTGVFARAPDGAPVAAAAAAAVRWLDSLEPAVREQVCFPVDSDFWRQWQNTPLLLRTPQVELQDLTAPQRELALEMMRTSLSPEGYRRAREVMANNQLLGSINDLPHLLNEWAFTLSIFGAPSSMSPWGWQFFGHHLALNCMFVDGQMVLSPIFMGMEPDYAHGPGQRRLFEPHEQRALAMIRSLNDQERERAVLYKSMLTADQPAGRYHPDDGRQVGGAFQDNRVVPYEGVQVSALGRAQRHRLLDLAEVFIENLPDEPSRARMREIERYLDQTYFAWIGLVDDVNPFYFRIHSPVTLIEFDHHSGIFLANEEPERFHAHTIVRTPNAGDYGADLLSQHYARGGHDGGAHGRHGSHGHGAGEPALHSHDGGHTFHTHD